jgi:sulfite reductase alpha subunit-like flavoprotein
MEEDFIKWVPGLIQAMASRFEIEVDSSNSLNQPHVPLFNVQTQHTEDRFQGEMTVKATRKWKHIGEGLHEEVQAAKRFDAKHPYYGRYVSSKTLFVDAKDVTIFKDTPVQIKSKRFQIQGSQVTTPRQCYHIELDLGVSGLSYKTGDHVGVWGNNDVGQVEKLGNLLKIDLNDVIKLVPNSQNSLSRTSKAPFPQPSFIRDILRYYLDIMTTIKQHHLTILGKYAADEKEKAKLFHLAENREDYVSQVEAGQKTLACTLEDFPSIKVNTSIVLI